MSPHFLLPFLLPTFYSGVLGSSFDGGGSGRNLVRTARCCSKTCGATSCSATAGSWRHPMTSWWLNQPLWKICSSKWESSPKFQGENKKYLKPPPRWSSLYSSSFFKPWPFDPPKWRSQKSLRPEKVPTISSETRSLRRSWLINSSHFNRLKRQGILRMKILNMYQSGLGCPCNFQQLQPNYQLPQKAHQEMPTFGNIILRTKISDHIWTPYW